MINPKPVEGALRFARRIMFAMAYCCGHPRGGCPNHCDLLWAAIKRADEALNREAALSAAPAPDNPNDTMEYWRSRAITAEQKVLEFHEQIALLAAPARDGVREAVECVLREGQHNDWCGAVLSDNTPYPCNCWKSKLLAALAAKEQADGQG